MERNEKGTFIDKEQGTVVYINWPKNVLGVKCAFIKA
jgi:hypothetical protein